MDDREHVPKFRRLRAFRRWLALAAALATALSVSLVVVWSRDSNAEKRPTLAQLASTNYRTLTEHESRLLLRLAQNEYACLSARGFAVTPPVATRTRITIKAPGQAALPLAQAMMGCEPKVGAPPRNASLQARPGEIVLYLPKRCLMNPRQLSGA